jgi:Ni,Fe-hydrogenase I large subunit
VIERSFARMFTVAMLKEVLENIEDPGGSLDPVKGVKYSMAVGAHDAPRGANAHWVVSKDGTTVSRYGIVTPTDRNFSPGGPVERGIVGERVAGPGREDLNALRVVRSFDPCSACAVHLFRP